MRCCGRPLPSPHWCSASTCWPTASAKSRSGTDTMPENPAPQPPPVLECRNLSISYYTRAGEVPAVVDFNLTVMPGEAVGIVGESGCGKSTVALAIMQYMGKNGAITGGEIRFLGRDMRTMSEDELRRIRGSQISMVYQEPMASLNPSMLVKDQLIEVPMIHEGINAEAA